jgi:hypothetical protein
VAIIATHRLSLIAMISAGVNSITQEPGTTKRKPCASNNGFAFGEVR